MVEAGSGKRVEGEVGDVGRCSGVGREVDGKDEDSALKSSRVVFGLAARGPVAAGSAVGEVGLALGRVAGSVADVGVRDVAPERRGASRMFSGVIRRSISRLASVSGVSGSQDQQGVPR